MKKALLMILLIPATSVAQFKTGNQLYGDLTSNETLNRLHAIGYVQGVVDAYQGLIVCPPAGSGGVTAGQVSDMVKNYLTNVPGERHLPAAVIIGSSLGAAFPCTKQGKRM
jgi:hypothetical protein